MGHARKKGGSHPPQNDFRRPFIVALTLVGVAGIATLVLSGTGTAGGTGVIGAGAVLPLAFAGFCVSDVAHECLLGPGRALAGDQAASDKERASADAMFSGMQMLGRFLAMVLGSLPLKRLVAHARAGVAVHMQVLMAISGGVSDLPCNIRREGGQSLVIKGSSLVI